MVRWSLAEYSGDNGNGGVVTGRRQRRQWKWWGGHWEQTEETVNVVG